MESKICPICKSEHNNDKFCSMKCRNIRTNTLHPKLKTSEASIQKAILQYLIYKGVFCWRSNSGAFAIDDGRGKRRYFRAGIKGCADIIGVYDGRFICVECKRPGGNLSDLQKDFLDKIWRHGGIAIVATSVDDVVSVFRDMGWEK